MTDHNWHSLGYAKAMMAVTAPASLTNIPYPTQDKFTPENERDYIGGYNEAMRDYQNKGFNSCYAYVAETQERKDAEIS